MQELDKQLLRELIQKDWGFTTLALATVGIIIHIIRCYWLQCSYLLPQ